ncbi:hypothetical protein CUS38_04895 [Enterococcus faecium]|uniref:LPXTG cell wall anchor domain-containing protein n=1 Tax=Enterococcus faecium TaxID=1352 RepID=UPI000CF2A608|nr:LPXTG cell wall anchor domain-containing protein [Enterococcus faecium]PQG35216.1 hypothetical protein CUS38_04895 [Enterococcus faecium]
MRNKFHKLLSMFLVMLIVINQFGNITVLAESLAEQPERSLTIEVDQEEAALGEQFQLRVRGTPDLLNALVIDKSEDLIEGEVKQLNDYERLITYSSQHSGKYELTARSGDIQSNTVSIEISVPEESTSESFNVPEESTSESFNIPEESLSESFNEARSSEPSITQESQIERQEELLNYDIGISAERPTLPSRHTQTLKGYIQGGAGDVVLTKIDDQSGEVLQGAVFELQDANGTVLQSGLTTGADGKLAIEGLAPGAYQLVETQAPTGYELDATPVTFKIEKEQEVAIFLTKENRKVADSSDIRGNNPTSSGNKHLPKTGETIISQFILSILGVLLVFISIKFRKKRNI